jgi:hypothetical protein
MNYVKTILHKGREVICIDFSKESLKTSSDLNLAVNEANEFIRKHSSNSLAVALINVNGLRFTKEEIDLFIQFAENNKSYIQASAIVGVKGFVKIALNNVGKAEGYNFATFNDEAAALDWVVER